MWMKCDTRSLDRMGEPKELTLIEVLLMQYVGVLEMRKSQQIKQVWMQATISNDNGYPYQQLYGPMPHHEIRQITKRIQWKWPSRFQDDLLTWWTQLQWIEAPGQVTFMELALDFEAWAKRPILPPNESRLAAQGGMPLAERSRLLRMAISALHTVICETHEIPKVIKKSNSLVPLGSPKMIGMVKRPYFTI